MIESFKEKYFYEKHDILESEKKADLKNLKKNQSPRVGGITRQTFQAKGTESIKSLLRICQQIFTTPSPEAFNVHSNPPKRRCQRVQ